MSEEINKGKLASLAGDLMYNSKVPINLLANSSRFVLDKKSGTNEMAHFDRTRSDFDHTT